MKLVFIAFFIALTGMETGILFASGYVGASMLLGGALLLGVANLAAGMARKYISQPQDELAAPTDVDSFQHILEDLPVALIRLTPDGVIEGVNRAARTLLGSQTLVGKVFSHQVEGLGRSMRVRVEEALKGGSHRTTEMGRYIRNSKEVFLQISLMAMTFANRRCLVVVLSDKTELKILEAQFVQSQKMQAVGQLAGGVAHDFNNLLTAINGHSDLLLLRHTQEDSDYGDLIQIRQNVKRAAALVRQLLAFSRKQTLRPKVLKLSDTLAQLTELLNRLLGEKVNLRIDIDEGLNLVRVDERQLEQVIMNLVVNARDAMLNGGEVLILAKNISLTAPLERDRATVPVGDYVCISVKDSGVGIAPDKVSKIFEPFYTTKKVGEGTGLGLSTVYGIIKQTGGFVFVNSIPGHGTEFIIYLPAYVGQEALPRPEQAAHIVKAAEIRSEGGRILLVEDEPPVRTFAARALKMRGYVVDEAESAEQALAMIEKNAGAYDMYISDIIMPGLDGPTWVSQALQHYPETKVIFMSGYAEDAFEDGKNNKIEAGFLQKPFSLSELNETVQAYL
jgi:two-component system cell cycle sensor histidine kinase/response regulator CckA